MSYSFLGDFLKWKKIGDILIVDSKFSSDEYSLDAIALGLDKIDVSSPEKAQEAMQIVKDAINQVSRERSKVGATQNRLEYTMANLEETYLNLSEANSRIRDVDYAKMMMEYTKNQLLEQVSTTILTHRMSNAQNILQLFN